MSLISPAAMSSPSPTSPSPITPTGMGLPALTFCCNCAYPVDVDKPPAKLHRDPHREKHQAIYLSFLKFAVRRQKLFNEELVKHQAHHQVTESSSNPISGSSSSSCSSSNASIASQSPTTLTPASTPPSTPQTICSSSTAFTQTQAQFQNLTLQSPIYDPLELINNPLTPSTSYVVHLTSRHDFGRVWSHRYFVCPLDLEEDWQEITHMQWWAWSEAFKFQAQRWDLKCTVEEHKNFFRLTLRPNLGLREDVPLPIMGLGMDLERMGMGREKSEKAREREKEREREIANGGLAALVLRTTAQNSSSCLGKVGIRSLSLNANAPVWHPPNNSQLDANANANLIVSIPPTAQPLNSTSRNPVRARAKEHQLLLTSAGQEYTSSSFTTLASYQNNNGTPSNEYNEPPLPLSQEREQTQLPSISPTYTTTNLAEIRQYSSQPSRPSNFPSLDYSQWIHMESEIELGNTDTLVALNTPPPTYEDSWTDDRLLGGGRGNDCAEDTPASACDSGHAYAYPWGCESGYAYLWDSGVDSGRDSGHLYYSGYGYCDANMDPERERERERESERERQTATLNSGYAYTQDTPGTHDSYDSYDSWLAAERFAKSLDGA